MDKKEIITILVADDHPVFRKGLFDVFAGQESLVIVGETGDGDHVLSMVRELKPTILLLDLNMPGLNGLEIAATLHEEKNPVKIIILTMHKEEAIFNKAMDLGVLGYVLKESAVNDIIESIRAVVNDEHYISPTISRYLMNRKSKSDGIHREYPILKDLTPNERRILKLISENKSSNDIAKIMFISVRTVENHRMNICNKLNLHGSNALLKFAIENKSYL